MEWITNAVCESPLGLYIGLGAAQLVLAIAWLVMRNRKVAWVLLAPPILAGAIALTDWLVVTDREQIRASVVDIARKVEAGDIAGAADYIAADMDGFLGSRQVAIDAAKEMIRSLGVTKVEVRDVQTELAGDKATTYVRTSIVCKSGDPNPARYLFDWTTRWERRQGKWKVVWVDPPRQAVGI